MVARVEQQVVMVRNDSKGIMVIYKGVIVRSGWCLVLGGGRSAVPRSPTCTDSECLEECHKRGRVGGTASF